MGLGFRSSSRNRNPKLMRFVDFDDFAMLGLGIRIFVCFRCVLGINKIMAGACLKFQQCLV